MRNRSDIVVCESSSDTHSHLTSSLNTEKVRRDNLENNLPMFSMQNQALDQFQFGQMQELRDQSLTFGNGNMTRQGSQIESGNDLVSMQNIQINVNDSIIGPNNEAPDTPNMYHTFSLQGSNQNSFEQNRSTITSQQQQNNPLNHLYTPSLAESNFNAKMNTFNLHLSGSSNSGQSSEVTSPTYNQK